MPVQVRQSLSERGLDGWSAALKQNLTHCPFCRKVLRHVSCWGGFEIDNRMASAFLRPSHSQSHHAFPAPPPILLRPPRRAGCPRAHRLPAGEAPILRRVAVGRDCGNGGVFARRPCLPRLPPPHPQQQNAVWGARAVLCLCELWHSPLREASREAEDPKLGLIFESWQQSSQPISKPPHRIFLFFLPSRPHRATKSYKPATLTWINQWWSRSPGVSSSGTP